MFRFTTIKIIETAPARIELAPRDPKSLMLPLHHGAMKDNIQVK